MELPSLRQAGRQGQQSLHLSSRIAAEQARALHTMGNVDIVMVEDVVWLLKPAGEREDLS